MTEERGRYEGDREAQRIDLDGVQRIGDLLRQIVKQRDWPVRSAPANTNGDRRDDADRGCPRS